MNDTQAWVEHRGTLFAVAYRMLGSVTEAEDVVQEAYLRWQRAEGVDNPEAWLVTVVGRLALDQLRSARVRRESYVGPWLPEPLATGPDVADEVATADSVSLALLLVLERLSPAERAVFVLREVFDYGFAEIAGIVGRSEAACRQLAVRARAHVAESRPRFETDSALRRTVTERFLAVCAGNDLDGLLAVLDDDATLYSDGGGKVRAATRPIRGADAVARFILGIVAKAGPGLTVRIDEVNGGPAIVLAEDGVETGVVQLGVTGERIGEVWLVVNPDKLAGLRPVTPH